MSRKLITSVIFPILRKPQPAKTFILLESRTHFSSKYALQQNCLWSAGSNVFKDHSKSLQLCGYASINSSNFISFSTRNKEPQTIIKNVNGCIVNEKDFGDIKGGSKELNDPNKPQEEVHKLSLFKRFKAMYRDYWYVLVPVHIVTSIGWFGTFFYLAKSGFDLAAFAEALNLSESIVATIREKGSTTTGYLALSYFLYKVATPLRYTVTLGGTTISINYLKKWGYIKPMPKKEELKKILNNKREQLKEKRESYKRNFKNFRKRES